MGARLVEADLISELYRLGKVSFLGDRKVNGEFHALYESNKLPLIFYAVPVMQTHG